MLLQDAPTGLGAQQAGRYATLLAAVSRGAEAAGKPLVAVTNLSDEPHPELARVAREAGVPYLRGTREGMAAIGRYAQWATRRLRTQKIETNRNEKQPAENVLKQFRVPAEHEARRILASYGIAGPQERFVATAEEAAQAAAQIGFPVALKGMMPGVIHKSEAGMVKLRIASRQEVLEAAKKMSAPAYLVQKMMSPDRRDSRRCARGS